MIGWCRDCGKDIRWTASTMNRKGVCDCARWTMKVRIKVPGFFEEKSPTPRGSRSRARRHKQITHEAK